MNKERVAAELAAGLLSLLLAAATTALLDRPIDWYGAYVLLGLWWWTIRVGLEVNKVK